VGLRFFNVYGPRQDPSSPYSGVIAIFADRLRRRREIDIFGDGLQTRDFIYVADVVAYLLAAMELPRIGARVLNVCTGRATSVLQLAHLMGELFGTQPTIRHRPARSGDIRRSIGDPGAVISALGFAAGTEMSEGLKLTLGVIR